MQKRFSDILYAAKKKLTQRDRFLAEIDSVTPWGKSHKAVEPFYPKVERAGRPPIVVACMLRMYVAQHCFGLSDEGIEGAIYDSQSIRSFVGIDLGRESAPDTSVTSDRWPVCSRICVNLQIRRMIQSGNKWYTGQVFTLVKRT